MKKIYLLAMALLVLTTFSIAQTQKNFYIIGAQLSDMSLNLQKGNTAFGMSVSPRVAWFIQDNIAVGAEAILGVNTSKNYTQFNYGVGPIARLYFGDKTLQTPVKSRLFVDANVGLYGQNVKSGGSASTNTNGLGVGFGPGLAYFLNQNIALEGLLKYNITAGFGNASTNNSIGLRIGFQIHLPQSKLKQLRNEVQ